MTQDERVGLRAVYEPERDTRIGGVVNGSLTLDDVPVIRIVGGRKGFGGARDEVADDCVDTDTAACDENAGLAGRPESCGNAAANQLSLDREAGEHLAYCAIGAHCEQPPSGSPAAGGDRGLLGSRMADIEEASPESRRRARHGWYIGKPLVKSRCDIQSCFQSRDECGHPLFGDPASETGDSDYQKPPTCPGCGRRGQRRKFQVGTVQPGRTTCATHRSGRQ